MAGGPALGGLNKRYNGRMTFAVYFVVILGGCGGLLLGYDNGVIGGVTAMHDFQKKFFYDSVFAHNYPEEYLQENPANVATYQADQAANAANSNSAYCKYDNQILQLIVSSLYLAAAASGIFSAHWARKFGRKPLLFISGVMFIIGAALQAAAQDVAMLVIGRVILGIGVGVASLVAPMYNAEMAPAHLRGGMNILFQLSVTVGILVAGLINYGADFIHPWGWRLSLGLAAAPGFIVMFGGIVLPDSPVSYVERGRMEKARSVLVRLRGVDNVDEEFQDIIDAARQSNQIKRPWRNLLKSEYRPQLYISLAFMMFQQFTGINAIIFYAPVLFSSIGNGSTATLENTCIIGAVNVVSTLVAVFLVDRLGRKFLLIEGGVQMIIAEIIVGVVLKYEFAKSGGASLPHSVSVGVLVVICVFIAGFAWSWGPIGWLYPTEIQPLETRAAGSSLNVASNMIFTFVIGQCFVTMLCTMEWGVFIFFMGMVVIMTTWTILFLPETKGSDLENTFRLFQRHWFWGERTAVGQVHSVELPKYDSNAPKGAGVPDDGQAINGDVPSPKASVTPDK